MYCAADSTPRRLPSSDSRCGMSVIELVMSIVLLTVVAGIVSSGMITASGASASLNGQASSENNLAQFERFITNELRRARVDSLTVLDDPNNANHILQYQVVSDADTSIFGARLADGSVLSDGIVQLRVVGDQLVRECFDDTGTVRETGILVEALRDGVNETAFGAGVVADIVTLVVATRRNLPVGEIVERDATITVFVRN